MTGGNTASQDQGDPEKDREAHLQESQSHGVLLQQQAMQRHPLADELHHFLLGGEDVGALLLIGAVGELSLVGG